MRRRAPAPPRNWCLSFGGLWVGKPGGIRGSRIPNLLGHHKTWGCCRWRALMSPEVSDECRQEVVAVVSMSAPGKLILAGDHAAVYGCPAIAVAIGLRCHTSSVASPGSTVLLDLSDIGVHRRLLWQDVEDYQSEVKRRWQQYMRVPSPQTFARVRGDDPAHLALVALGEVAAHAPGIVTAQGLRLSVRSQIPSSSGMGSSAAAAATIVAATLSAVDAAADAASVDRLVHQVESRQHGQPSGIDQAVALRGGAVKVSRDPAGAADCTTLSVPRAVWKQFSVYDTGPAPESTGDVVAGIRRHFEARKAAFSGLLAKMTDLTEIISQCLTASPMQTQVLIKSMRGYQMCLQQLGTVPRPVQDAVCLVESLGGAAKVCGAGSLTGPGAGALLVIWPRDDFPIRATLDGYPLMEMDFDVAGLRQETV